MKALTLFLGLLLAQGCPTPCPAQCPCGPACHCPACQCPSTLQCPGGQCPIRPSWGPSPGGSSPPSAQWPSQTNAGQGVATAAVRVTVPSPGGTAAGGSGTCLFKGATCLILTARHVVTTRDACYVEFPAGPRRAATVLAVDPEDDLAALELTTPQEAVATGIAPAAPQQGAKVCKVGYPHGQGPDVRWGVYEGDEGSRPPRARCSCWGDHGDSGCGVFSESGQLVGVLVSGPAQQGGGPVDVVELPAVQRFLAAYCWPKLRNQGGAPASPPRPAPASPPVTPPVPAAPLAPPDGTLAKIDALIASVEELKKIKAQPGPKGDPGKDGQAGPAGPKGDPGAPAGPAPVADLQARVAALEAAMKNLGPGAKQRVRVVPAETP